MVQWCPPGGFEPTFMLVVLVELLTLVYMLNNLRRGSEKCGFEASLQRRMQVKIDPSS